MVALALAAVVFGSATTRSVSAANLESVPTNAVPLYQLPPEARTTFRLVRSGGPFPYAKDGLVFANRERALPRMPAGYYREYTVRTPGSADRGGRRLVCGGYKTSRPDACFFTGDHYASFRQIVE